ncbi:MAG TPA: hypothetical protein VLW45_04520 [Pelomicrobium sp.]|nr:hypothetical protein [Pelomicrobium sp.]
MTRARRSAAALVALLLAACAAPTDRYVGVVHDSERGTRGVAGAAGDGPTVTNRYPGAGTGDTPAEKPSEVKIFYDINVEVR